MSRTINITVTNRTNAALYFKAGPSQEGPACTADKTSVAAGGTITVTAKNSSLFNGGNKGTFTLNSNSAGNGATNFVVFYTHPQLSGTTYVQLQNSVTDPKGPPSCAANCVGTYYQVYEGDPVNAAANIYLGVGVSGTSGYAVPLDEDPYIKTNNCTDFANSMFGPNMRDGSVITGAFRQSTVPYHPADFSGGQMPNVMNALENCWKSGSGTDWPILQFLQNYIAPPKSQNLPLIKMWVPVIAYDSTTSSGASVFNLSGYQAFDLASYSGNSTIWNDPNVRSFLMLLAGGAHFVAISADRDFVNQGIAQNNGRDLYATFRSSSLPQRGDPVNSHYANLGNVTGQYYLNINEDVAPQNCGLILALLFGRTVNSLSGSAGTYNTFMQLEGWPATGTSKTTWHNKDYAAYQQTLWNTATYGACPYSEKRATTVFLAPEGWTPQLYQTTRMMPYVGAYASGKPPNGTPQDWLNTSMVEIPGSAPSLPDKYYD
jgi:hypothetical protein